MAPGPDESLDLQTLSSSYAAGRWSVKEVVDAVLRRIAACPDRAIFIDLLPAPAIDEQINRVTQSGKSPADLPLYGVPFAVKDNIDVAGRPTTAACPAFAYVPRRSATVVEKLRDAGAILIGKTNLDQFATGLVGVRSPYGICVNPFDSRYIVGGSSSGSAVAVARGLVSFALGTDTAGSGRVPAAFNNIVGLKPSRGLLSNAGVVPACQSLDCVSVFALTCGDAWRVTQCARGFDPADPYSRGPEDFPPSPTKPVLRFGVPKAQQLNFFGNSEVQSLFEAAISRMRTMGGIEVAVDCQPFFDAGRLLYDGPWLAERYGGLKEFLSGHRNDVLSVISAILDGASRFDAASAFDGFHRMAELIQAARKIWERIDVLLLPTAGTIYRIEQVQNDPIGLNKNLGLYTSFANLMDLCAVAVPAGFGASGLPAGISLIAPAGHDGYLAEIAGKLHGFSNTTLGATGRPMPAAVEPLGEKSVKRDSVLLAVVGAHLSGQPLNGQLTSRGATLVRACRTWPCYRLFALAGTKPPKPGLVKTVEGGAAIEVEVWELNAQSFGSFVAEVPPPMVIGTLQLDDGTFVKGFLCEPYSTANSADITSYGGWRAYLNHH